MLTALEPTTALLPADRPRYLDGPWAGLRTSWPSVVARGVDMFDCVLPTRNGR